MKIFGQEFSVDDPALCPGPKMKINSAPGLMDEVLRFFEIKNNKPF